MCSAVAERTRGNLFARSASIPSVDDLCPDYSLIGVVKGVVKLSLTPITI
jgi:hypothetical protein